MAHSLTRIKLPAGIPDRVEVWQLELDLQMAIKECDLASLSETERTHALRFYAHADRVRSIATRSLLRKLLAEKTASQPEALHFVTNEYGKPGLRDYGGIEFNVSHSGSFALIALSMAGAVGVDIERHDRQIDVRNLSQYVFTRIERENQLETREAFIQTWVAKESVLKALGVGIANHLQAISILSDDNQNCRIVHENPAWEDLKVWWIPAPDGYAAALATISSEGN
ncbi:MAG: hypothetical protein DYH15_07190 [Nitrosomonas sp. PRO4]|nr:hypothetical protein [Nitrosomonas sp. PRO4]